MTLLRDSSQPSATSRDTPRNRMAVYYRRRIAGRFCASIEITPDDTTYLTNIGLLDPENARDKVAVSVAIGKLLTMLQRQARVAQDSLDLASVLGAPGAAAASGARYGI